MLGSGVQVPYAPPEKNPPLRVGEIIFDDEIPCGDEIRLDGGWVDLISSEAARRRFHPNSFGFHPAKQDFINSRKSSNLNEKGENIFFTAPSQKRASRIRLALFYFFTLLSSLFI